LLLSDEPPDQPDGSTVSESGNTKNMWENCWNWMMSFGWLGMFAGTAILVALVVLIAVLIVRISGGGRPQ
jgi:hypothetical protein